MFVLPSRISFLGFAHVVALALGTFIFSPVEPVPWLVLFPKIFFFFVPSRSCLASVGCASPFDAAAGKKFQKSFRKSGSVSVGLKVVPRSAWCISVLLR